MQEISYQEAALGELGESPCYSQESLDEWWKLLSGEGLPETKKLGAELLDK